MVYLCTPCIHTADYPRRFSEDALSTLFGIVAPPYQRETRYYSIPLPPPSSPSPSLTLTLRCMHHTMVSDTLFSRLRRSSSKNNAGIPMDATIHNPASMDDWCEMFEKQCAATAAHTTAPPPQRRHHSAEAAPSLTTLTRLLQV